MTIPFAFSPPPIAPDATAQLRTIPLVLTCGRLGYRLAFAGGASYETVADFADGDAAWRARKSAVDMMADAMRRVRGAV